MQESDPLEPLSPGDTHDPLDPARRELADALRALQPAAARIGPREIWYRAGLESGRRRANRWRAAAGAMAVATGLSLAWAAKPTPAPAERIVYVRQVVEPPIAAAPASPVRVAPSVSAAPPAPAPAPTRSYARLCDFVSEHGLDGLPQSDPTGGGPPPPSGGRPDGGIEGLPPAAWYR